MSTTVIRNAEDLATELLRRVALCTIAQGAETDLGATLYEGRRKIDDGMIPCAAVIEGPDKPGRAAVATQYEIAQQIVIYAYVPCDPGAPNRAARRAIRDLKRVLFTADGRPDPTWGRRIKGIEYLGKDIGPRADGAAFVVAAVEVAIHYVEDLAAP